MQEQKRTGYPSIDKPWLKYYEDAEINSIPPKLTTYENIYRNNKNYPHDIALLYFGKKITYAKLFTEIDKTAKAFTHLGIQKNDNVSLCMPAVPETIYAILALNKLGANASMLNPTFSETQLTERIKETNATVLLTLSELYDKVRNVISNTQIKTVITCPAVNALGTFAKLLKKAPKIPNTLSWNDFIKAGKESVCSAVEYQENQPAIMVFSSGTTGAAKGIQLTNDSINWAIVENPPSTYGFKRGKRYFLQIPVWFSTGIVTTGLVPLYYGVTIMLEPLYDFSIFENHIRKYQPNYMITATGLVEYLMQKADKRLGQSWECLAIGGEYASPTIEKRTNKWLKDCENTTILRKGYGMCECGGSAVTSQVVCNRIGAAGVPTPHVIVSAFDLETRKELPYGERGEMRVLTPCRMLGYFNRPDETAQRLQTDENGNVWVHTGDMGYVVEDGNVVICGRINDAYVDDNGNTIYLFDIEHTVLDIENVKQCKAVSIERGGKTTHVCHIVIDDKCDRNAVLNKIKAYCSEKLPADHQPNLIHIYKDALPVAPSGKLDTQKMKMELDDLIEI